MIVNKLLSLMVHRIAIWRYFCFIRAFVFQKLKPTMNLKLQLKSWCHLICCWTESHASRSIVFELHRTHMSSIVIILFRETRKIITASNKMYLRINKNACIINEAFSTPLKYWPLNWLVKSNFQKKILKIKLLSFGPYANILN